MSTTGRARVVVVAEASPMRGGIATFAETIVADPGLAAEFDLTLLNTARTGTRQGGRFNLDNLRHALTDAVSTFRASRQAGLVHLQLVADPGLPIVRAAALVGAAVAGRAKVIAHIHSAVGNAGRREFAGYRFTDRLLLRCLGLTDLVCTVSHAGTRTMRPFAGRTPVHTVDNAVPIDQFEPTRVDRQPPTVLFVGVICRRKGTVELARAARLLHERGVTDWRLVVVGGQGPTPAQEYREILAEFAAAGHSAALVGPEYGIQVRERLAEADLFVLPSFLEGQPIAILEAMASGVPVIGTSIGAVPDVVRDGRDGVVVEPGDVNALADALERLIADPALRRVMGESARARTEAFHTLERLSQNLATSYRAVLADGAPQQVVPTAPEPGLTVVSRA